MDPDLLVICGTICICTVSGAWYKLRHRDLAIRAMTGQLKTPQSSMEQPVLRQEIAKLRETTTQFDMSVERALTEMQHRIATLEAIQQRSSTGAPSSPQILPAVQTVEAGRQPTS